MSRGRFITLEGGEGAGKSTQMRRLAAWLEERGIEAVTTREPGGSPGAEAIRALLVDGATDRWDAVTEAMLHFAARRDHLRVTVLPALERGAWAVPSRVEVMELNIPAIHGVGKSRIYFVDRYDKFSIYDVDFVPIPTVDQHPPAVAGLHFFGIVQYIGNDRTQDWAEFYRELFGFTDLPDEQRFGVLPKGRILQSPCPAASRFYVQLIEPEASVLDVEDDECLQRIGLGTADVLATVADLGQRGVEFVQSRGVQTKDRGALTRSWLQSVSFELVHDDRG